MHLKGLITLAVLSALPLLTTGCRCIGSVARIDNTKVTSYCCGKFKGKMDDSGCQQKSIRKKLKSFLMCCIEQSPGDRAISNCNVNGASPNEVDESDEELERITGLNATEITEMQRQNAGMMEEDDA